VVETFSAAHILPRQIKKMAAVYILVINILLPLNDMLKLAFTTSVIG